MRNKIRSFIFIALGILAGNAVLFLAQQGAITIKSFNSNRQAQVSSNQELYVTGLAATPLTTDNLLSTPQTVSAVPSTLDSFQCTNTDSTNWAYVQVYDVLVPVVGTTQHKQSYGLPPGGGSIGPMGPLSFTTGITVAATTTAGGSTSVDANEVNCNWGVK